MPAKMLRNTPIIGKKILIISHDASLTGAPVLLLNLVKLLKEKGFRFNTLFVKGGGMVNQFREQTELCDVFYKKAKSSLFRKLERRISGKVRETDISPLLQGVDYVLSNTITNGEILARVRKVFKGPVISYIHELEMVTFICTTEQSLEQTLKYSDHFIVDSGAIKGFLNKKLQVEENKISVINSYNPPLKEPLPGNAEQFRATNRISATFVVGALATAEWRKGPDLFVLIAGLVHQRIPSADIQFVWMGGKRTSLEKRQLSYDLERIPGGEKVVLIDGSPDIGVFFDSISLFILPSREDPYPLVVLDAASKKIPVICFAKSGGAPEFIEDDAGMVIDYLDINSMADAICMYFNERTILQKHGERALQKARELHHDKALVTNQIINVLTSLEGKKG